MIDNHTLDNPQDKIQMAETALSDHNEVLDPIEKKQLIDLITGFSRFSQIKGKDNNIFSNDESRRNGLFQFVTLGSDKDIGFQKKLTSLHKSSSQEAIALVQFYLVMEGVLSDVSEIDGFYGNKTKNAIIQSKLYDTTALAKGKKPELGMKNRETKNKKYLNAIDEFPDCENRSEFETEVIKYNPYVKGFASVENHGKIDMSKHGSINCRGPYGFLRNGHLKALWQGDSIFGGESFKSEYPNYDVFFSSVLNNPSFALKISIAYESGLLRACNGDIRKAAAFNLAGYAGKRNYENGNLNYRLGKNKTIGEYIRYVERNSQPNLAILSPQHNSDNSLS